MKKQYVALQILMLLIVATSAWAEDDTEIVSTRTVSRGDRTAIEGFNSKGQMVVHFHEEWCDKSDPRCVDGYTYISYFVTLPGQLPTVNIRLNDQLHLGTIETLNRARTKIYECLKMATNNHPLVPRLEPAGDRETSPKLKGFDLIKKSDDAATAAEVDKAMEEGICLNKPKAPTS